MRPTQIDLNNRAAQPQAQQHAADPNRSQQQWPQPQAQQHQCRLHRNNRACNHSPTACSRIDLNKQGSATTGPTDETPYSYQHQFSSVRVWGSSFRVLKKYAYALYCTQAQQHASWYDQLIINHRPNSMQPTQIDRSTNSTTTEQDSRPKSISAASTACSRS